MLLEMEYIQNEEQTEKEEDRSEIQNSNSQDNPKDISQQESNNKMDHQHQFCVMFTSFSHHFDHFGIIVVSCMRGA